MSNSWKKRIGKAVLSLVILICGSSYAADLSPVGLWKTVDDQPGKERGALIRITEKNGEYQGRIEKIFSQPGDDPNPRCEKCDGARHNQPIVGLTILWGLTKQGDEYGAGEILDPESGRIYRVKMTPTNGGKTLDVRGFIGFSLIGRTQTWIREDNPRSAS
jgi:uncharacterized protein (DUF2147 family)